MARLLRWARQSTANRLLQGERVAKCYRVKVKKKIETLISKKYKRAFYKGLMTCGSVWHCPVCAAKITERRRVELQKVIDLAKAQGFYFVFVTFTLQHTIKDELEDVADVLTAALTRLKNGGFYNDFKIRWGFAGDVTNAEIMYGAAHGWHFHKHALFFTQKNISAEDCQQIQLELVEQYQNQLKKKVKGKSYYAHPIHGVNVRVGDSYVADYLAKFGHEPGPAWSLASEVSKSFTKSARQFEHYTPFQLLDLHRLNPQAGWGSVFKEYAEAMKGSKQLRYSKQLRLNLGITEPEKSDEEIAAEEEDDSYLFSEIDDHEWDKIIRNDAFGMVLEVASTGNIEHLKTYLSSLPAWDSAPRFAA